MKILIVENMLTLKPPPYFKTKKDDAFLCEIDLKSLVFNVLMMPCIAFEKNNITFKGKGTIL